MTISPSYHIALPCTTLQTPHFTTACLAAHALHLSLDEIRGRSDACNPTLTDMYQRVGCRRVPTGFGSNSSASDADGATSSTSGDYIEWAIATPQLMRALAPLAPPAPTSYRVRRVSIPLPPPIAGRPTPQRSSTSPAELPPSPTLSQAASAAFARGDVDGAKLLWQQLLQVCKHDASGTLSPFISHAMLTCCSLGLNPDLMCPHFSALQSQPPPARLERLEALQALAVLGDSQ